MKKKLPIWWGYLDDQGVIHIKRYVSDWDIHKCEQMPFCRGIFEPFTALTHAHARIKISAFLDEQQAKEKKLQ